MRLFRLGLTTPTDIEPLARPDRATAPFCVLYRRDPVQFRQTMTMNSTLLQPWIQVVLTVVQIAFYVTTGIIAFVAFRRAERTLLQPRWTESYKEQGDNNGVASIQNTNVIVPVAPSYSTDIEPLGDPDNAIASFCVLYRRDPVRTVLFWKHLSTTSSKSPALIFEELAIPFEFSVRT
jgi:hypothetical protein